MVDLCWVIGVCLCDGLSVGVEWWIVVVVLGEGFFMRVLVVLVMVLVVVVRVVFVMVWIRLEFCFFFLE